MPLVISSMPLSTRMLFYYYVWVDDTEKANKLLSDSVRRLIPLLLKETDVNDK